MVDIDNTLSLFTITSSAKGQGVRRQVSVSLNTSKWIELMIDRQQSTTHCRRAAWQWPESVPVAGACCGNFTGS